MQCGIYAITHTPSGRAYIGASTRVARRLTEHRRALDRGRHANTPLQADYTRDGSGCFTFALVELCPPEDLAAREEWHILHVVAFNDRAAKTRPARPPNSYAAWRRAFAQP